LAIFLVKLDFYNSEELVQNIIFTLKMVKMYLLFLQLLKAFEVFGHWEKLRATVWLGNKS